MGCSLAISFQIQAKKKVLQLVFISPLTIFLTFYHHEGWQQLLGLPLVRKQANTAASIKAPRPSAHLSSKNSNIYQMEDIQIYMFKRSKSKYLPGRLRERVCKSAQRFHFQCDHNHITNSCIFFQYILFSWAFYSNGLIKNSKNLGKFLTHMGKNLKQLKMRKI